MFSKTFKLLNDRTVFGNLEFVLKATGWKDKEAIKEKINEVLDKVGMKTQYLKNPLNFLGENSKELQLQELY